MVPSHPLFELSRSAPSSQEFILAPPASRAGIVAPILGAAWKDSFILVTSIVASIMTYVIAMN